MQIVVRAAKLERAGALKTFRLVANLSSKPLAEHIVVKQRRSHRYRREYLRRSSQILNRYKL